MILEHCFYQDMCLGVSFRALKALRRYFPALPSLPTQEASLQDCQQQCNMEPNCRRGFRSAPQGSSRPHELR